jgi:hypothetical protein
MTDGEGWQEIFGGAESSRNFADDANVRITEYLKG